MQTPRDSLPGAREEKHSKGSRGQQALLQGCPRIWTCRAVVKEGAPGYGSPKSSHMCERTHSLVMWSDVVSGKRQRPTP